jgi:hypothetical protein
VQSEVVPYKYVTVERPGREHRARERSVPARGSHPPHGPDLGDLYIAGASDEISDTCVLRPERWSSIDYAKMQS